MDETLTTGDRVIGLVSTVVPLGLLAWLGYVAVRMAASGTPTLTLDPDHLVIRHPSLFRGAVEVPRSSILAVDVDVGTEGGLRRRERFAIERSDDPDHGSVPTWLYSAKHGSPLPVIGHFREVPNLAIALREPFRFKGVRRVSRPVFRHTVRSPIRTKDARGFLVAARHPFIAEQQFRAWGADMRRFTTSEAVALLPGPGDHRRQWVRSAISVAVGILLLAGQAYVFYRATSSDPAARCLSAAIRTGAGFSTSSDPGGILDEAELEEAIIDAPSGYIPEGLNDGFDDPAGVGEARGYDELEWQDQLAAHGFVNGHARRWSGGSVQLASQVVQTAEVGGAVGLHAWAVEHHCGYAHDAYVVDRVPGALALRYELDGGLVGYEAFFVRGRRLYMVSLSQRATVPSRREFERYVEMAAEVAR